MTESRCIDKELIQGYLDNLGVAVVAQMLDLYINQSEVYLSEISGAIEQASQPEWQERCHKMKGAAGSVGLLQVHAHLVAIEKSTEDWTQKSEHVARLSSLNSEAILVFKEWLASQ